MAVWKQLLLVLGVFCLWALSLQADSPTQHPDLARVHLRFDAGLYLHRARVEYQKVRGNRLCVEKRQLLGQSASVGSGNDGREQALLSLPEANGVWCKYQPVAIHLEFLCQKAKACPRQGAYSTSLRFDRAGAPRYLDLKLRHDGEGLLELSPRQPDSEYLLADSLSRATDYFFAVRLSRD